MNPSNTEKMILRLVEAVTSGVKAELVRRAYIDWTPHFHIKVSGALNTMFLVKADFSDDNYGIEIVKPLYSGKNERLINLAYTSASWVAIGDCRYASFSVTQTDKQIHLYNEDFFLYLCKTTGEVKYYTNSNEKINYLKLFLNPETNITDEL